METEDRRSDHEREDAVYKTKIVEFLGRSTPIVLQNDNGPCPLIAICNVLLLRNSLNLTPETTEVSLQRLLSVIAEKLIDCNCNVEEKDDGYVSNQQQNIADAIDLLPRLATGIDVNVQFKKINDFEFTRECAIFDLLDIGLYHGWIVDPQDTDTAAAIGTKSYNTLVGELVAFETRKTEGEDKNIPGDDDVDFVAATTATLGVPSPSLSSGRSFNDCPATIPVEQVQRRGDIEEVMELMRALDNSKAETSSTVNASFSPDADFINSSLSSERIIDIKNSRSVVEQIGYQSEKPHPSNSVAHQESSESNNFKDDGLHSKDLLPENGYILPSVTEPLICNDIVENVRTDTACETTVGDVLHGFNKDEAPTNAAEEDQAVVQSCNVDFSIAQIHQEPIHNLIDYDPTVSSVIDAASCESFHLSNGREELPDTLEVITSSLENTEPIYEGEECIHGSGLPLYEEREPVYEGETLLAEQTNKIQDDSCSVDPGHNIQRQWQSIKNFLQNSASQLTIYGLFCLQEGLKERELCVFFRNNHFNTMFKFNGQLYLLATDQGYITQPDLVWEKLNEVNGDTVFMTGNFKEFKVENQVSDSWNEQSAMTSTADYLAALEVSSPSSSAMNSDLQLAISLQQQEFEQQQPPQRHQQQQQQQQNQQTQPHHNYNQSPPSLSGRSRLFTGPQGSRNPSASSQKNDSKSKESKDKCAMM